MSKLYIIIIIIRRFSCLLDSFSAPLLKNCSAGMRSLWLFARGVANS